MARPPALRRLAAFAAVAGLALFGGHGLAQPSAPPAASFAADIAALSETEVYIDTDNLISNEWSYLSVIGDIEGGGLRGGAYVGVGPDQNFSYIAAARPDVAFIIDIRRDNLLLHLLFKALFSMARTRVEYLALLCGRAVPADAEAWKSRSIGDITRYVDNAPPPAAAAVTALRARVTARIASFGVPLSAADMKTIDRFHRRFIEAGLDLRFQSFGRAPQDRYPNFRQLLLEVDGAGKQRNYLASEDAFAFVKSLEARNRVIPVVGNLGGRTALLSIGRWLEAHDEKLSLLYASNVEFYLFREDAFAQFVDNLTHLPHTRRALLIRSVFGGGGGYGGGSVSLTQNIPELLDGYSRGRYRQYWELAR
jgi:hypothetical protein